MFKCHKCNLVTKQLNGLMSRHYIKHCDENYTKEQYKREILINHNRPPKICPICGLETKIPAGGQEYSKYHRQCELSNRQGVNNYNYRGGKLVTKCAFCDKEIIKHKSHLKREHKFCSVSCSQRFYGIPGNRTEAQRNSDKEHAKKFRERRKSPEFNKKMFETMIKQKTLRKSKKETDMVNVLKTLYLDTIDSYLQDFFVFDAYIPSLKLYIEFQGDYWHSLPLTIATDKRKNTFVNNKYPDHRILYIWEHEWDKTPNQLQFLINKIIPFLS